MAKISLRAYFKKIEGMINDGSNDEAIRHSRYILKLYPKCTDAYRSLAKAHLEKKEYPEAKDIFSRILSVFPDDFVSHIGLSIISESDGNLDAAIWHMEQAYEIQPSNPVLTEELRRLFGRRDGMQPPKIRMTRGALIRMYARGELYQQATAECQSVLLDDPKRIDIEVILARIQYLSGALIESAEICSKILNRFPYCYEANRLMVQIAAKTSQSDSANLNRVRLAELDPYFGHITSPDMESSDIPDGAILLDLLDDSSQMDSFETPRWSKPDEFTWDDTRPLKVQSTETKAEAEGHLQSYTDASQLFEESPFDLTPTEEDTKHQDESIQRKINALDKDTGALYSPQEIPDWILNAGWKTPGDSTNEELDNSTLTAENVNVASENAEPAELPDWLGDIQPAETSVDGTDNASALIINDEVEQSVSPLMEVDHPEDENRNESLIPVADYEIQNPSPEKGETGEIMPSDSMNKNEDEWLNQFREGDSAPKENQNDLPDWLKDFESENEQPIEENMDIPDWLKSLEPEPTAQSTPASAESPAEETPAAEEEVSNQDQSSAVTSTSYVFTKMLMENEPKAPNLETTMLQPETEPEEEAAAVPSMPEPVPAKPVSEPSAGLPSWVRNILKPHTEPSSPQVPAAEEIPQPAETLSAVEPEPVSSMAEEPPVLANEVTPPEIPSAAPVVNAQETPVEPGEEPIHDLSGAVPAEGAISTETSSELLDWLRGFGEGEEQPRESAVAEGEVEPVSEPVEESPIERLGSFAEPVEAVTQEATSEMPETPQAVEEPMIEPVSEGSIPPAEEEAAQPDSWFEEILHEPETLSASEEAQPEMADLEPMEAEELIPVSENEEVQTVVEEPVASEPQSVATNEESTVNPPVVPEPLSVARDALQTGDISLAVNELNMALQDDSKLTETVAMLKQATMDHEQNTDLWLLLGDAYARSNQFGDAFSAYDKVESLLLKSQK